MNMSASKWSSGCDSGWTFYLNQSSFSNNKCHSFGGAGCGEAYRGVEGARMESDADDDLSMVSDASSGPRHCNADNEEKCCGELDKRNERNKKKKKKVKRRDHSRNQLQSSLDDTASSSLLGFHKDESFSKNEASMDHVLDSSQGFSATNLGVVWRRKS